MITSFEYEDLDGGWKLSPVRFDPLNLLVGPSGAGKTRILQALMNVRRAGLRGAIDQPSSRWTVELSSPSGSRYRWTAEVKVTFSHSLAGAYSKDRENGVDTDAHFVSEHVEKDGVPLIQRDEHHFRFDAKELPRLDRAQSAVGLLADEDDVEPLVEMLYRIRELQQMWLHLGAIASVRQAETDRTRLAGDLDALRRDASLPPFLKLYVLQLDHPEAFREILEDFCEIFPGVEELRVATYDEMDVTPRLEEAYMAEKLVLGMREEGVDRWIVDRFWSTGMVKTLVFLIESALAPAGSVFLVDELENGLGVNCLPDVAGRMLEGLDRIQYIATSHHPRVINEIPMRSWKLVTREGATVKVLPAEKIPSLRESSPLEHFTQLLNSPEYEEALG